MQKTSKEDFLAALEDANQSMEDEANDYQVDNAPVFESEAERAASEADKPKRIRNNTKPLTERQRLFATLVIQGKTKRQAYRDAYSSQMSDSAVSANASKLAADPRIAQLIGDAWNETVEHLADDLASTKRYVMRRLLALSKDGRQEGSRLKALELLGKSIGLFNAPEETKEKTVSAEQLKRELSGHLRLLDNVKPMKAKKAG